MKIGTIALLVVGVIIVNRSCRCRRSRQFIGGGGPIIPGPLFPFVFITIACGAISGLPRADRIGHDAEDDRQGVATSAPIGYGAMLIEGLVGIMALIAATAMLPGDYFAINTPPAVFANARHAGRRTCRRSRPRSAKRVAGRTGGAVSLAVGMAQIFSGLPGMRGLMDYWYHFAIMFEALFILTTIDAGTRVARFLVQEFLGRVYTPLGRRTGCPGSISRRCSSSALGLFHLDRQHHTIWPMFGIANQLLAAVALAVGTTIIINIGQARGTPG